MLALAYANGANDVSKAIATLVGSAVTNYRTAILWGTFWTVLGAVAAASLATAMLKTFTTGLLTAGADSPIALGAAIIGGAVLWVLFASWRGLPVSTTHAIVGGVCGGGVAALGVHGIAWPNLAAKVIVPLAFSPVAAFALTWVLAPFLAATLGRWQGYCLCLQPRTGMLIAIDPKGQSRLLYQRGQSRSVDLVAATQRQCDEARLSGLTLGLDSVHWLSSGAASFARGLNDAPKIVSLLVVFLAAGGSAHHASLPVIFALGAVAMGVGSYFGGRRVTEVLAEKVTAMDHVEGLAANLTTSVLVSATAVVGLPVSTTHVSCSAIVAVGVRKGVTAIRWTTVKEIVLAWIVTLPAAAILAGLVYFVLAWLW